MPVRKTEDLSKAIKTVIANLGSASSFIFAYLTVSVECFYCFLALSFSVHNACF